MKSRSPREGGPPQGGADAPGPSLSPGLHIVATPVGNARDITLRALDALAGAEVLAAEDTRTLRRLMEIHGIPVAGRPLLAYHDHSDAGRRQAVLEHLRAGRSVALTSEAGTPLIADPGWRLARAAAAEGLPVTALPGASAVLPALCLAGLPTDRFLFAGFPPAKSGARRRWLGDLAGVAATLVLYESPRRLAECLADAAAALGAAREAAVCRELTKRFEEVRRGSLATLAEALAAEPPPKGEIVLVIGPPGAAEAPDEDELDRLLDAALDGNSVRDAARQVADATGLPRRDLYRRALSRPSSVDDSVISEGDPPPD